MKIRLNGKEVTCNIENLEGLLKMQGFSLERIIVECNGRIIPSQERPRVLIAEGDTIEVLSFVGGG